MLSRKGAARSPRRSDGPGDAGSRRLQEGGSALDKAPPQSPPPAPPQAPRGAGGSQGPFLRDGAAVSLRPSAAEGLFYPRGLPTPGAGAELPRSSRLAGGDPRSARTEPSAPLRGRVNLRITRSPSPREHVTDTSPSPEHPAWKPASPQGSPRAHTRGKDAAVRQVRGGRRGATLSQASPPTREITKAKVLCVRGVLGRHPSPAFPPDGTGPAGYHFPRGPPAARPGTLRDGDFPPASVSPVRCSPAIAPPEAQHPPTAGREKVEGSGHPPCCGLQPSREDFPVTRGPLGPPAATAVSPRVAEPRFPACGRPFPGRNRDGHPGSGWGTQRRLQPPTPRPVGGCGSPVSLSLPRTRRVTLARVFCLVGWSFPFRCSANTQPLSRRGRTPGEGGRGWFPPRGCQGAIFPPPPPCPPTPQGRI
ncbi:translation initiation factor IF-2-like [Tyto alba]|uniref:translation initiation factor IF-2-like n=1 Tax=Tyto alba TaxID=56313 RepID=UPI001C6705D7|nr:translation initiation factor IF-2-like [Tyto alba]